jgi:hypothetical protein
VFRPSALRLHLEVVVTLLLCLVGLLGYVLFVPLVTMVRTGSPAYEWFFYLGLALLGTASPVYASLRLRQSRLGVATGLAVCLLAFLLGAYVGAVFTGTPLLLMALLGYGVTLFSLHAVAVLVVALKSAWFSGMGEHWVLVALGGLVFLVAVSWGGFGHKQTLNPRVRHVRLSFWGGWDANESADEVLAALRDTDATVYAFTGEKLLDNDVRDEFRRAMERYAEYDVEVVLASILPSHDGFVSVVNYDEYISYTERLLDFADGADLVAIAGVIADAEPPYSIVDPWKKETARDWIFKENGRYRRWDAVQYEQAHLAYSAYIGRFHQRHPGLSVMVSTIQSAIFDALDGDADLSIAYKFAAYPPRNWDVVNVQVYSSHHAARDAPYFTWQGIKLAQSVLEGQPLSISVGIVGEGSMRGAAGFRRLVEDIRLCRALGVEEVIVFSLERGLKAFGPNFVARLEEAVNASVPLEVGFSRVGAITPYGASLWDAVLDLRGSRGLIVLGWCVAVLLLRIASVKAPSSPRIENSV